MNRARDIASRIGRLASSLAAVVTTRIKAARERRRIRRIAEYLCLAQKLDEAGQHQDATWARQMAKEEGFVGKEPRAPIGRFVPGLRAKLRRGTPKGSPRQK